MDPFSHALWSVVIFRYAKILNFRVVPRPLRRSAPEEFRGVLRSSAHTPTLSRSMFWVMFFGLLPDLFSSIPFLVWRTVYLTVLNGYFSFNIILREWFVQIPPSVFAAFDLFYNLFHSVLVFISALILFLIIRRWKVWWPFLGWGLHLALDVFSHAGPEHGVRIFYPFSDFYFGIFNWFTLPFTIANVVVLALAGGYAWFKYRKTQANLPVDNFR